MATGLVLVMGAIATAVFEGKPEAVSPEQRADPARLGSVDSNRYRYWEVALETWADRPLRGIGSGGFQVEWLKVRDRVDTSGDAHSLYLETGAELGIVGVALLLGVPGRGRRRRWCASTAWTLARRRGRRPG